MRSHEVNAQDLRGRTVIDSIGNSLGSVEDVTLDPAALRVTGLVVRLDAEAADALRVGRPMLGSARVEIGADRLASIGDTVLLNVQRREMAGMLYDG